MNKYLVLPLLLILVSLVNTQTVSAAIITVSSLTCTSADQVCDDFTQDSSLNSNLWQVNGPVGTNVIKMLSTYGGGTPGEVVTPNLSFSSVSGLAVSGVDSPFRHATIQSQQSFSPPFIVEALVMATVGNSHPFALIITSTSGGEGVSIDGSFNRTFEGNFRGIFTDFSLGTRWANYAVQMVSSPSTNIWYLLAINVNATGYATLSVGTGGHTLGSASRQSGLGPFYIVLAQYSQISPGPDQAYWQWIRLGPLLAQTSSATTTSTTVQTSLTTYGWYLIPVVVLFAIVVFLIARKARRPIKD